MATVQRRRGQKAILYPSKQTVNSRGGKLQVPDEDRPIPVKATFIPQRSARAELSGQQQINIYRMLIWEDVPEDVDMWGHVWWRDIYWDMVTPPMFHHGTRHVRHWAIDIRERP